MKDAFRAADKFKGAYASRIYMVTLLSVGIKTFIRLFGITVALIKVSAAQEESTARVKLVLLVEKEENILSSYYCLYTVNAAGV
ncbi:hypothetical protein Tco_1484416 [Tanacetum coccineum]